MSLQVKIYYIIVLKQVCRENPMHIFYSAKIKLHHQ